MNATTAPTKLKTVLMGELEKRFPDDLDVGRFELENEWHHHFEFGDPQLATGLLEDDALLAKFVDSYLDNIGHLVKASKKSLEIEQILMAVCTATAET